MSSIWNGTMTTSSSSEMYANCFQESQKTASEGTAGSAPMVTQQDQIATVSYRPGDVAKPNETAGEISVALPVFGPKGTMDFHHWATNGWDANGGNIGPAEIGERDYTHEPSINDANMNANR